MRVLARIGAGEQSLVGLFMERRQDFMRFLLARTGSKADAEDALQDVYLKLCGLSGRDGADILDPAAYLYRLCHNVVADRRRGGLRSQLRDDAFHKLHTRTEAGYLVADAPSPETVVEARLRLERILEALHALPPQQRRVFRMHRIQGLSHREISETLGISRSAVEKHMIAALKRLAVWEE